MASDRPITTDGETPRFDPFRVGSWRVMPSRNLLLGTEGEVQVTHKGMEILCRLAEADGEVVARRDLIREGWPDTVVNEEALTRVISDLRRALGDDRSRLRYIETIPKKGYRLVADVVREPEGNRPARTDVPREFGTTARSHKARPWRWILGAGLLLALTVLAVAVLDDGQPPPEPTPATPAPLQVGPLTSSLGHDAHPAFSPDGTRIAFARRVTPSAPYSLFIKQPGQSREIRLTDGSTGDRFPAWSPDGASLAFIRVAGDDQDICRVPSLGGPVEVIHTLSGRCRGLDWSPDGASLVVGHAPLDGKFVVRLLDLASRETRVLAEPLTGGWGDRMPRFSPTGDRVAFIRNRVEGEERICLVPVGGGPVVSATPWMGAVTDLDWYPDGRRLVMTAAGGGAYRAWTVEAETEAITPVDLPLEAVSGLSLSSSTGLLALRVPRMDINLIRYDLTAGAGRDHTLIGETLFPSTRGEFLPAIDPTGSRLAFLSTRTGEAQIYLGDTTGGDLAALTAQTGIAIGALRWSPDGNRLLISGQDQSGRTFLALVDPAGGDMSVLPLDFQDYDGPVWSTDGEWIYFNGRCALGWRMHRVRPDGTDLGLMRDGPRVEIVHQDAGDGAVYFIELQGTGLHRLDPDGTETQVADYPPTVRILSTGSLPGRILYVAYLESRCTVISHDLATARHDTLGVLPERSRDPMALAPDGTSMIVSARVLTASDLVMVPLPLD